MSKIDIVVHLALATLTLFCGMLPLMPGYLNFSDLSVVLIKLIISGICLISFVANVWCISRLLYGKNTYL